jgi:Cu/Ag efflux pump CusA
MEWLIALCVRRRAATVILGVLALILEIWGAWNTPLDVFPEFVPSQVTIHTDAPGFTAEQVEQLVTHPIEKALNGSEGVATVRSESIPDLSVVRVSFASTADLYNSRQDVSERLSALARTLPQGAGVPELSPLTSSTRDLLKVGLVSNVADAYALRELAEYEIKPKLLALPGVALVNLFGGKVRQIQIQPDPRKLTAFSRRQHHRRRHSGRARQHPDPSQRRGDDRAGPRPARWRLSDPGPARRAYLGVEPVRRQHAFDHACG